MVTACLQDRCAVFACLHPLILVCCVECCMGEACLVACAWGQQWFTVQTIDRVLDSSTCCADLVAACLAC
jgi:hypothetical protein